MQDLYPEAGQVSLRVRARRERDQGTGLSGACLSRAFPALSALAGDGHAGNAKATVFPVSEP
jgi:hypothetical protein